MAWPGAAGRGGGIFNPEFIRGSFRRTGGGFMDKTRRSDLRADLQNLVRGDEWCLRGHLPGDPLLPGVLLVEAAAQLAGVVAQNDPEVSPLPELKLTALRAVKILGTARPGETIRVEARVTGRLGNLIQAKAEAFLGDKLLLTAELTLAGQPVQK